MSLNNLSSRLAEDGQREEALAAIQAAVEIYRRLAAANPAAYEPALAMSLNNLSSRLAEDGQRERGPGAPSRRRWRSTVGWPRANPAAHEPDLAMALNNLSNELGEDGRREQALAAIQAAVGIYRRLAAANPAAYEPGLAGLLNNLSQPAGRGWAARARPWPPSRRRWRSTVGWPRPTRPPTNPASPCR